MSRTVAALYDSRAEAEFARAGLVSELQASSPRIIGKDTLAAVDGLNFEPKDTQSYREGLRRGGYLLVAELPSGTNPERVVDLIQSAIGKVDERPEETLADSQQSFQVEEPGEADAQTSPGLPVDAPASTQVEGAPAAAQARAHVDQGPDDESQPIADNVAAGAPAEEARVPVVGEELRIGKREVARGGARVRSLTRESAAEEQVALRDEVVEIESRPTERRLTDRELEAGGLFKERAIEIAEMREEPVVTKVAVVHEEVIVRKTVKERTETIRDTVRHTEVEVEDLPAPEGAAPTFFGRGAEGNTARR